MWDYDDFEVYESRGNGLPDNEGGIGTHEFLRELADHLEADVELDVQMAGSRSATSPCYQSGTYSRRGGPLRGPQFPQPDRRVMLFVPREGCRAIQSR